MPPLEKTDKESALDAYKRRAPLCEEHSSGSGARSGCPYCAILDLYHALSRIDYAIEVAETGGNEYGMSSFDAFYDEEGVVERVQKFIDKVSKNGAK